MTREEFNKRFNFEIEKEVKKEKDKEFNRRFNFEIKKEVKKDKECIEERIDKYSVLDVIIFCKLNALKK